MIDINIIRDEPEQFARAMENRWQVLRKVDEIIAIDALRRSAISETQTLQEQRNSLSRQAGLAKQQKDEAGFLRLTEDLARIKVLIPERERNATELTADLHKILDTIPNIPMPDVAMGLDENDNTPVLTWGDPSQADALEHDVLGTRMGLMDGELAAKLSGSRHMVLRGDLARMERAIGQFMIDHHTQRYEFEEISAPVLVNPSALYGTGQLPKFGDDLFAISGGAQYLIPTAEVTLTNLVAGEIIDPDTLPMRLTALTACFRAEAGSAGRDTRGMMRQHQFQKCELVSITRPEQSEQEHDYLLEAAMHVLKRLELPFRVVKLCTGDMGFAARRTYDIEVWLPGQKRFREISSVSTCGDFQARRMNARTRGPDGKTQFVHTLNGSGLAVGRTLIAIMENYQNAQGGFDIPDQLRPFMGGQDRVEPR